MSFNNFPYRSTAKRNVSGPLDGRIDNDAISFVYQINPTTGLPTSDLQLISSADTPHEIRESILSGLQKMPSSVQVDEETQTILLRPRACQSLGEVKAFADSIESYLNSQDISSDKSNKPLVVDSPSVDSAVDVDETTDQFFMVCRLCGAPLLLNYMEIFKHFILAQSPLPMDNKHNQNQWIGAAITGAASLVGGLFGSSASKKAAQANLQAARETNATNLKLAREQNEWNLAQWQRENAYNDPSAQLERYQKAGINPYMAMSNIESGNASSLSSADLANQNAPQTNIVPDYSFLGQAANSAVTAYNQTKLNDAQVAGVQLDNDLKRATMAFNVLKASNEAKGLGFDNTAKELANSLMQQTFNEQAEQARLTTLRMTKENVLLDLQANSARLDNAVKQYYKDNIQPQEAAKITEEINNLIAETYATYQEVYRSNRLADWQIKQMKSEIRYKVNLILQGYKQLDINQQQADSQQLSATSQANLNDSQSNLNYQNAVGNAAQNNLVLKFPTLK